MPIGLLAEQLIPSTAINDGDGTWRHRPWLMSYGKLVPAGCFRYRSHSCGLPIPTDRWRPDRALTRKIWLLRQSWSARWQ